MASSALEEKINKIRQQNEEIRRRYEEVEEDKKNAAKSNALVQMVPSSDWPERKEPPEFSNPPRVSHKPKPSKEHSEHSHQHYISAGEGKKLHAFAQGEGPPPDPKYNFLADFEREERTISDVRDSGSGRGRGKNTRGNFKKKGTGKEGYYKDQRMHHGMYRDDCPPEYDAWRAERNRIDEDRISRQRTAEGNWRREWDNDKTHIVDDVAKRESRPSLGGFIKKDHKEFDKKYYSDNNEYLSHNRGNSHRFYQGPAKNYNNHDQRYNNSYEHGHVSPTTPKPSSLVPGVDERTVIATDKSLKVTLNQGNLPKGSLMSVKVNSPSIAGTGRVGPRQRTRLTYSGHSDVEANTQNNAGFLRQKSFEDKSRNVHSNIAQNSQNLRRSYSQRKKESDPKSPFTQKKDFKKDGTSQNSYSLAKSPKGLRRNPKVSKNDYTNPVQQSTDEEKETLTDKSSDIEMQRKSVMEVENDIVPCESDMCIDSMQKATYAAPVAQDIKICKNDGTLDIAQSERDTQNLKCTEALHLEANENDITGDAKDESCAFREDITAENNTTIDYLNESSNSTIYDVLSNSTSVLNSFEKNSTDEQYENNNLPLKESKEATENEKNQNILQVQTVQLSPEDSSDITKEQLVENIEADSQKIDDAKQLEVLAMTEDVNIPSLAANVHSVIGVDSQLSCNTSKDDKIILPESERHEVDIHEPKTVEITSSNISELAPIEDNKSLPLMATEPQQMTDACNQLQSTEKTENVETAIVKGEEQDVDKNTEVVAEEQSGSKLVSDNKSSVSSAAEEQSVIKINKQLSYDNEPVETQTTQERHETPVVEDDANTNTSIEEIENDVVDKLPEALTVESNTGCLLSSPVEINSVIEVNNQINESGDALKSEDSKIESVFPECKKNSVTYTSDAKCLETIQNPDEILTNDKAISSNEGNGAISDNLESQNKCSDISGEIEDNKVKDTEFVMKDVKE